MDFKFDWDKSMEIGIETIDLQHKELFKIARNVEQIIITNAVGIKPRDMLDLISEVRNYVSYHFYEEESFMKKYNYTQYDYHKKEHDKFREKIKNLDYKNLIENPYNALLELKEDFQNLVILHILVDDVKMANEIKKNI